MRQYHLVSLLEGNFGQAVATIDLDAMIIEVHEKYFTLVRRFGWLSEFNAALQEYTPLIGMDILIPSACASSQDVEGPEW